MAWNQGETGILSATFTQDGAAASPTAPVEVRVRTPGGSIDGPFTVAEGDTGVFEHTYTPSTAGTHEFVFESADGGVEEGEFYVKYSRFA